MKEEAFMNQRVKDMTFKELIGALSIKLRQSTTEAKPEEKKTLSDKIKGHGNMQYYEPEDVREANQRFIN